MRRLLWLLWLLAAALHAAPLHLSNENAYSPAGHIAYLEDKTGELEYSQVASLPFTPYAGETPNFGFSSSAYWFRIDLRRDRLAAQKRWWLSIDYPLLERVDVYLTDPEGILLSHSEVGSSMPYASRELPLRNYITELPLSKHNDSILYLRVVTQSSLQVPMRIYSADGLVKEIETDSLRVGLYYGIFVIIFLYNAGLYFYTRDQNYLRYLFFLVSFIMWQLSFDGTGAEHFWNDQRWIIEHGSSFWIAMASLSALYFSRSFLNASHFAPKADRLMQLMMVVAGLVAAASLILPYSDVIAINAALGSAVPLMLFVTGIIVLRRNYRPARFYIAGWSSLLIGTVIFAFNKFNLIPSFEGINSIQQIGSGIEMIFLSWALADRIHLLQNEYVDKLNHLNETLTEKVDCSLREIRKKDQLFVQQSRLAALGEMIEQIAHQWRQPLNTLALINQDLYVRHKLGQLDDAGLETLHEKTDDQLQYMSKTIDDFRNFYKADKSRLLYDPAELVDDALRLSEVFLRYAKIKTSLESTTHSKVSIAKNEMIQVLLNLFKNAHDAILEQHRADGEIRIRIQDAEKRVRISVDDNAGGIDPELLEQIFDIYFTTKQTQEGTGLGLYMSRYIVEESFGGKIWAENVPGGARFIIEIPAMGSSDT